MSQCHDMLSLNSASNFWTSERFLQGSFHLKKSACGRSKSSAERGVAALHTEKSENKRSTNPQIHNSKSSWNLVENSSGSSDSNLSSSKRHSASLGTIDVSALCLGTTTWLDWRKIMESTKPFFLNMSTVQSFSTFSYLFSFFCAQNQFFSGQQKCHTWYDRDGLSNQGMLFAQMCARHATQHQ